MKSLLASDLHMAAAGLSTSDAKSGGLIVMTIHGLSPGTHTVATYHHEIRAKVSTTYEISVDGKTVVDKSCPLA